MLLIIGLIIPTQCLFLVELVKVPLEPYWNYQYDAHYNRCADNQKKSYSKSLHKIPLYLKPRCYHHIFNIHDKSQKDL